MKKVSIQLGILFFSLSLFTSCISGKYAVVEIATDYGNMTVTLQEESKALNDHFLQNVREGKYDSTLFHRSVKGLVLQGGDPSSKGTSQGELVEASLYDTLYPSIKNSYIHKKGAFALANINRDSSNAINGPQFFIVDGKPISNSELNLIESGLKRQFTEDERKAYSELGGLPHLDGKFTVLGVVTKGIEVMEKIQVIQTDVNDRPIEDVYMSISISSEPK